MPTNLVNMDALIPRADFEFGTDAQTRVGEFERIQHSDLTYGSALFSVLRKPDFQRETAIWSPEKVRDLVLAFVEGDLVPAVILWRSQLNYNFIIDGAHRISSLIAWINDDYGIGNISQNFFKDAVSANKKSAIKTKEMVEQAIGPYERIIKAYKAQPSTQKDQDLLRKLANCTLRVQWLTTNDASVAERSFFKINEQGVPLSQTESILLYSRACPNAVAARAINQSGTGHKHWHKFGSNAAEIEKLALDLHDSLFTPELKFQTVKTSDLPIAGWLSQTTASVLLDMVNLINGVHEFAPTSKEAAEKLVAPDTDGTATLNHLKATRRIVTRICNIASKDEMASLDLHPMVYFYSENGRPLPLSFLAVVELMTEFEKLDSFKKFTGVRKSFEDFLVKHKDFIQQVVRYSRGQIKAVHRIKSYLAFLFERCEETKSEDEIIAALQANSDFQYLKLSSAAPFVPPITGKPFTANVKSRAFIANELVIAKRCDICGARVPNSGISFEHKVDKALRGPSDVSNLRFSHHYCNGAKKILLPMFEKYATTDKAREAS